jgi:hypothetical protein
VKHDTVEADFRCTPLDKRGEVIQLTLAPLRSPRLPPAQPQPALDRLAINPEFARNPFDALAAFLPRNHFLDQLRP